MDDSLEFLIQAAKMLPDDRKEPTS
jgi:hypothetical protein